MFTPDPIPRPSGPPASTTPLRDYLDGGHDGTDDAYVVLPRSLAESMPLPWQQQMTALLREFHQAFAYLDWPAYRVVPSRYEYVADLDENQLTEIGCTVEMGDAGELEYRGPDGEHIVHPESHRVPVSCRDPIPRQDPEAGSGWTGPQVPPAAPPPRQW